MSIRYSILTLFYTLIISPLCAQLRNVYIFPPEHRLRLNIETRVAGGISVPMGTFANAAFSRQDGGNAQTGWFGEWTTQHRFRRNALWSAQATLGYMQHGFAPTLAKPDPSFYDLQGRTWQTAYFAPSMAFRGGKRLKFELQAGAGLFYCRGGFAEQWTRIANNAVKRVAWADAPQLALGWRVSGSLGYALGKSKRWLILLECTALGFGKRHTTPQIEEIFDLNTADKPILPAKSHEEFLVLQSTRARVLNVGVGVRYQLYRTLYPHTRTKDGVIYH